MLPDLKEYCIGLWKDQKIIEQNTVSKKRDILIWPIDIQQKCQGNLMGKEELEYISGRNISWYNNFGKNFVSSMDAKRV